MYAEITFPLHAQRGAAYLTAPNIPARHAFSTRLGGVSTGVLESLNLSVRRGDTPENVRENWRRLGAAAGLDLTRAVYAKQVHSADVRIAHAADAQPPELEPRFTCDGFVTNEPDVPLAVFMADCLPALLHDPAAGVIGAVHCGWRGSVADILGAAVAQMCALGAHPADIRAAIGRASAPAASRSDPRSSPRRKPCCMSRSARSCAPRRATGRCSISSVSMPCCLTQLGVPAEQIAVSDACTMCRPDVFWSHRATDGRRGVQAAVITL